AFQALSFIAIPLYAMHRLSGSVLSMYDWHFLLSVFFLGGIGGYTRQAFYHVTELWHYYTTTGSAAPAGGYPYAARISIILDVVFSVPALIGLYATFTFPHIESAYG